MADAVTLKVEGLKELNKAMKALGPKIAKKSLRSALNAGIQVIKKDAVARAPVDTGRLAKKAIYVKRTKEKGNKHKEVYIVGIRTGPREGQKNRNAFYWWFHEFGTRYIAARPFLVPAFEAKKIEAFNVFKIKLKKNINKFVKLK